MTTGKKIGIWMDHSSANIMEFTTDPIETKTIESKFTHEVKVHSIGKGESQMNNKEQQEQSEYYKKLGEIIRNYEEVILFGTTVAKIELLNILSSDNQFAKTKIEVKHTDKMTKNQQHAFVREFFSKTTLNHTEK